MKCRALKRCGSFNRGVDLNGATPQRLTMELATDAGFLVTMGCGDECPVVPGLRRDDWPLPDPKRRSPESVRAIREEIRERVWKLVGHEGWWQRRPAQPASG